MNPQGGDSDTGSRRQSSSDTPDQEPADLVADIPAGVREDTEDPTADVDDASP